MRFLGALALFTAISVMSGCTATTHPIVVVAIEDAYDLQVEVRDTHLDRMLPGAKVKVVNYDPGYWYITGMDGRTDWMPVPMNANRVQVIIKYCDQRGDQYTTDPRWVQLRHGPTTARVDISTRPRY